MKPVLVPTTDVNSETGVLVAWYADDHTKVEADELESESRAHLERHERLAAFPFERYPAQSDAQQPVSIRIGLHGIGAA